MDKIQLGNLSLKLPLIQGGMGIGISRCNLAGAVAKEGGMGVLSAAQIGYDCEDFMKHPKETNLRELSIQIKKAKELSMGNGMIGVNIMSVTEDYESYVKTACEAGADAIISGAGLPTQLPAYAEGYSTRIAPIVSSAKSASVILKMWDRKYKRTADFVVIEGPLAGGHLGYDNETLEHLDTFDYDKEVRAILPVIKEYAKKYNTTIPVFLGGGIFDKADIAHALSLGVDGVQIGSRFVATHECDASELYKAAYVAAKEEDIVIVKSPVGMPGRAICNTFVQKVKQEAPKVTHCYNCLKVCKPKETPYCISQALMNAAKGNLDEGLIFCGARIGEIQKIVSVKELIGELF